MDSVIVSPSQDIVPEPESLSFAPPSCAISRAPGTVRQVRTVSMLPPQMPRHKLPARAARAAARLLSGGFSSPVNDFRWGVVWHAIGMAEAPWYREMREMLAWNNSSPQLLHTPIVASLRGEEWLTPVMWEAFEDEGWRRGRIFQNPLLRSKWGGIATRISAAIAPEAHSLSIRMVARRAVASHSFSFFTGVCEKVFGKSASLALLAGRCE